jgi:hypothetical protein
MFVRPHISLQNSQCVSIKFAIVVNVNLYTKIKWKFMRFLKTGLSYKNINTYHEVSISLRPSNFICNISKYGEYLTKFKMMYFWLCSMLMY